MSGEVSASSSERASAARRTDLGAVALVLAPREQLAGAALLADGVEAERGEREPGEEQPQGRRGGAARRGRSRRAPPWTSPRRSRRWRAASGTGPRSAPRASLHLSAHAQRAMSGRSCFLQQRGGRFGRDDAQLDAGAELEPGEVGRAAGRCRSASRSARRRCGAVRTHRFSGGQAPSRRRSRWRRVVQQRGAGRAVVLEARARRGAARASAGTGRARRTAPSAPPRRRSRRSARAGGPPPARGRRAGCRPSCAPRARRSARARGRSRRGRSRARRAARACAGARRPPRARSLTIRCRQAGARVRAHARAPRLHRGRDLLGGRGRRAS